MLGILERKWKKRTVRCPDRYLYLINTSGGGNRSATLHDEYPSQHLDSLSGGQLDAKDLYDHRGLGGHVRRRLFQGAGSFERRTLPLSISVGSPLCGRYIARSAQPVVFFFCHVIWPAPAQKFRVGNNEYIKDQGLCLRSKKLDINTRGLLNTQLKDLAADEKNAARMPMMLSSPVITRGQPDDGDQYAAHQFPDAAEEV